MTAGILGGLLFFSMNMSYNERKATNEKLHNLMERQTRAIETLVQIYSGKPISFE